MDEQQPNSEELVVERVVVVCDFDEDVRTQVISDVVTDVIQSNGIAFFLSYTLFSANKAYISSVRRPLKDSTFVKSAHDLM
jgi:hypothetical protein